jgi:hypothetical protein
MRCLVVVGKHVNDIWAVARQQPVTTIEKLLEAVFLLGSPQGSIQRTPGWLSELNCEIFAGQ